MTLNLYLGTMEWNIARGLTKTLNLKLENDMLEEEKKEFYDDFLIFLENQPGAAKLDALVNMVDALCDYMFVAIGTDCKVALNNVTLNDKLVVDALKSDAEKQIGLMTGIIGNLLGNYFDLEICYRYVLDANNKKPNKQNANGKNEKGQEWVDPKGPIRDYLLTLAATQLYTNEAISGATPEVAPVATPEVAQEEASTDTTTVTTQEVPTETKNKWFKGTK